MEYSALSAPVSPEQTPKLTVQEFSLLQFPVWETLSDSSRIFQQVEFQCMFFVISYAMLITFHIQRHRNEANQLSGFRACIDYSEEHSALFFSGIQP